MVCSDAAGVAGPTNALLCAYIPVNLLPDAVAALFAHRLSVHSHHVAQLRLILHGLTVRIKAHGIINKQVYGAAIAARRRVGLERRDRELNPHCESRSIIDIAAPSPFDAVLELKVEVSTLHPMS